MAYLYPHELDQLFALHPALRETWDRREEEHQFEVSQAYEDGLNEGATP